LVSYSVFHSVIKVSLTCKYCSKLVLAHFLNFPALIKQARTQPKTRDGEVAARPAAGRWSSQNILGAHPHPRTQPNQPGSFTPLGATPQFVQTSQPTLARAERSSRVRGRETRITLGRSVQLNGYWKRLAIPLDAAFIGCSPTR